MAERWVLNASPLIVLARIGHDDLFSALADEVVVPEAVATEIRAGPTTDRARQLIERDKFNIVPSSPASAELMAWDLGAGESAVIAYALMQPGWTAILDDELARRCARSFSISMKGTLAVVLLAKQRRIIPSASALLRSLRANGFRISDQVARESLWRTVGEKWDH